MYQGNNAKYRGDNWAIIQGLASRPPTTSASTGAGLHSLLEKYPSEQTGAEMAYTQRDFEGLTTWVELRLEQ